MTRTQLEHIIRAAGSIADARDVVVAGSQAILGQFPDAPPELLVSDAADVFSRGDPSRGELIDGTIGEDSRRGRLILVENENTRNVRGWCLEMHDLAIAKYAAAHEKNLEFTDALARHSMVHRAVLEERLAATPLDAAAKLRIVARIQRDFA